VQLQRWFSGALFPSLACLAGDADPGLSKWRNERGHVFEARPVEALGPYALFGPEATTNRLVKFRALNADDCLSFHRAVSPRPPRAARWVDAQGALTRELLSCVRPVADANRTPDDLAALPEPELLLIYFRAPDASSAEVAANDAILNSLEPFARRVRRIYSGRVEVVVAVTPADASGLPPASTVWMTADPRRLVEVGPLRGSVRAATSGLFLVTREGVPIAGGAVRDVLTLARNLDHVSALLWDLNPENVRTLPDRTHYWRAVRATQFLGKSAPPEMLSAPVRDETLRQLGVVRLDARIELDAEGRVTRVTLQPTSELPSVIAELVRNTIRVSDVFVPAIQDAQPVAGTIDYSYVVPPRPDPQLAAETAWVRGEARVRVPIARWLVLRPIRFADQFLATVNRVGPDGTVVLNSVKAGTTHLDSFRDNWFDHTGGAASVQPLEGQEQDVGGEKLVWQRVSPAQDLVDLARGVSDTDNCVGYAWTEVVSQADTDAWLGIGSDDAHKVWVNGRLVADSWVVRPSRLDDDVVPFRLRAGRNQILVKVQNETANWSFMARLRVREQ
jgi:hypothetical protein